MHSHKQHIVKKCLPLPFTPHYSWCSRRRIYLDRGEARERWEIVENRENVEKWEFWERWEKREMEE